MLTQQSFYKEFRQGYCQGLRTVTVQWHPR